MQQGHKNMHIQVIRKRSKRNIYT